MLYIIITLLIQINSLPPLYGVPNSLRSNYSFSKFTCFTPTSLHNLIQIPQEFINDNFCDCPDGSDEPGTSACDFQFFCNNHGLLGKQIPSSKVNDGICDCCDASDEYHNADLCKDTCELNSRETHRHIESEMEKVKKGIEKKYEIVGKCLDKMW